VKEYEIEVIEQKTVYVEAESESEAMQLAKQYAICTAPDEIKCSVTSSLMLS